MKNQEAAEPYTPKGSENLKRWSGYLKILSWSNVEYSIGYVPVPTALTQGTIITAFKLAILAFVCSFWGVVGE